MVGQDDNAAIGDPKTGVTRAIGEHGNFPIATTMAVGQEDPNYDPRNPFPVKEPIATNYDA